MASRRLRIKPVANVPIRRGRTTENAEKIEDKTEQPKEHKPEEKESSAVSSQSSSEKSGDQNAEQIKQSNQDSILLVDATPSVIDDGPKGNSEVGVVKPPLLVGKRLKPAVNVAAIKRPSKVNKLKEVTAANEIPPENHTSQKSECTTDNVKQSIDNSDTASVPFSDVEDKTSTSANMEDKPLKTLVRPSLNKAVLSNTARIPSGDNVAGNEHKLVRRHVKAAVNIAALSRLSRKQNTNNLADDKEQFPQEVKKMNLNMSGITELQTKEAPQKSRYEKELISTKEKLPDDAEMPTGVTSISDENSKSINSGPKYRSSKPVPNVQSIRVAASSRELEYDSGLPSSIGESDDDPSLSQASTISPPPAKQPRISKLVTSKEHTGNVTDSDEDNTSRHSFSSASTITPPRRTFSEAFVRKLKEDKDLKRCVKPRVMSSSAVRFRKAKLEFFSKFNGINTVDRSRLTMMDLIFYNPLTNPMKYSEKNLSESTDQQPSGQIVPEEQEERADDPDEGEEEAVALPVPQVKVGPDGQIVLDERSLVIETTGAKKNRETLAKSAVIVDTGTTGNGFYRRKFTKVKEWSTQETLKFYRALNIIGTDFLVMQSIFPKRSRRDLKLKFKREERINSVLVEKALRNPLDFDLTELEKELEKEEEEERRKSEAAPKIKKQRKEKRSFLGRCMNNESFKRVSLRKKKKKKSTANSESDEENEVDSHNIEVQQRLSEREFLENEPIEDTSMEVQNSLTKENDGRQEEEEDDEEEEIQKELQFLTKPPRPTRCGRVPQQKRPPSIGSPTAKPAGPKQIKQPMLPLKDLSNIEPGSLVVIATQSPTDPGHQVYKVFMVAPPPNTANAPAIAPIALSPKVVQPDSESNLKLCSNETLCFTNTQSMCPAAPPPACSRSQTSFGNNTSAKQEQHYLNTSLQSVISNPQEQTSNTDVLTQSVPFTTAKHQMMSIGTSEDLHTQVIQSESTFIPISSLQSLSSSQQAETSASPQSETSESLPIQVSESNSFIPISSPQSLSSSQQAKTSASSQSETSEGLPIQVSESDSFIPIPQSLSSSQQAETSARPHSNTSEGLPIPVSESDRFIPISSPRIRLVSSEQALANSVLNLQSGMKHQ